MLGVYLNSDKGEKFAASHHYSNES